MNKRVLLLGNHAAYIYNFRLEIIKRLLKEGCQVTISSPNGDRIKDLIKLGCTHHDIDIDRHGINPWEEFKLYRIYKEFIKQLQPDVVLTYTIKPNLYGGMACSSLKVPFIANITGLGGAIERGGLLSFILYSMYRFSLRGASMTFFQNEENRKAFLKHRIARHKERLIPGSGVNIERFSYADYPGPEEKMIFTFIGRLMKNKGIEEFIKAAKTIKGFKSDIIFRCIGFIDTEDTKMMSELSSVCDYIEFTPDIRPYIAQSQAVVLPSYHEGMANVLLEAAAMGRPVIASNVPGCIETFDEGITGFGCEVRNADSLADAILRFIHLPWDRKKGMGQAGREKMEREFDRNLVVEAYIQEIEKI